MEGSILIDTKEKLRHCMSVEKKIYFPEGGGYCSRLGFEKKMCYTDMCLT